MWFWNKIYRGLIDWLIETWNENAREELNASILQTKPNQNGVQTRETAANDDRSTDTETKEIKIKQIEILLKIQ